MKIIDNKYEMPISIILGMASPIYLLTRRWVWEDHTYSMIIAADKVNYYGTAFVLALAATFCLANARKVKVTPTWMKGWDIYLKIWIAFTLGQILFVHLPKIISS